MQESMSSTITPESLWRPPFPGSGLLLHLADRGRRRLARGADQLVADAAKRLCRRQAAIADGGIHIVQAFECQLFQKARQQLGILQHGGIDVRAAHLALEARLAVHDVLLALFLFEPLLDLRARAVALADIQPVAARALGRFRRQNLDNVAVAQLLIIACNAVVDLCADHGVADAGMDGIGKVDGGGAGRQGR